jgi:hypothetical protein
MYLWAATARWWWAAQGPCSNRTGSGRMAMRRRGTARADGRQPARWLPFLGSLRANSWGTACSGATGTRPVRHICQYALISSDFLGVGQPVLCVTVDAPWSVLKGHCVAPQSPGKDDICCSGGAQILASTRVMRFSTRLIRHGLAQHPTSARCPHIFHLPLSDKTTTPLEPASLALPTHALCYATQGIQGTLPEARIPKTDPGNGAATRPTTWIA